MRTIGWRALLLCVVLAPMPASADLYQAAAAVEKQDLARAFELYRELAEMGQPVAQENLAVMYVNGEGVKRDNVLGYAWASMALENGGGEGCEGHRRAAGAAPERCGARSRGRTAVQVRQGSAGAVVAHCRVRILPSPRPRRHSSAQLSRP